MVMFRGRTAGKPLPNGPSSPFLSTYYFVGGGVWCTRTIKLKRFECIERREPRKSRILHHSSYNVQKSKIEMCDGIFVAMESLLRWNLCCDGIVTTFNNYLHLFTL